MTLLDDLLEAAGLPAVKSTEFLTGHGFDHEITLATLVDGHQVVLRRRANGDPLDPAFGHAAFFAEHDVPAPKVHTRTEYAVLVDYVPGEMLATLIKTGRCTDATWQSVGEAFRRLHAVRFPLGLTGTLKRDRIVLTHQDPVADLHAAVTAAKVLPEATKYLPAVHALIDSEADRLRSTPPALLHKDVNTENIIVGPRGATLIDWGYPQIGDPRAEISALDEHVYLAGAGELPEPFFTAYGVSREDLHLKVHRLTGAIGWLASEDWDEWSELPPELTVRIQGWHGALLDYLRAELPKL